MQIPIEFLYKKAASFADAKSTRKRSTLCEVKGLNTLPCEPKIIAINHANVTDTQKES